MLKLIYTETNLHIEKLTIGVEDWIGQRVLLALRAGQQVAFEPLHASFGLSPHWAGWPDLEYLICREASEQVSLSLCDADLIEIGLEGYWLSYGRGEDGVFVAQLPTQVETALVESWQAHHQGSIARVFEAVEDNR
jgi:hypothetical protein